MTIQVQRRSIQLSYQRKSRKYNYLLPCVFRGVVHHLYLRSQNDRYLGDLLFFCLLFRITVGTYCLFVTYVEFFVSVVFVCCVHYSFFLLDRIRKEIHPTNKLPPSSSRYDHRTKPTVTSPSVAGSRKRHRCVDETRNDAIWHTIM